ncbi:MAG TPA: hypothetical protein VHZ51_18685 [Ktedonobacteraceae bacterium]|jgi:hypothetical protein|nr:hypothetical protein [Ktedonobacteraceae bacterium]
MTAFDPDQATRQFIELHDRRDREIDQRPDLQHGMDRGHYDFTVDADYPIRELQNEAERNGYYLDGELDFQAMKKTYICRKMTPEEREQYLEWEKAE